jgi:hypothetical protein
VTGDGATGTPPLRPLDLPGLVLWLDADVGIAAPGSASMTWTDQSAFRHGHGAVRFNGRDRFISEQTPTSAQKDALSLGSNFVVGLVFVPEREIPERAILTLAMLPWIPSPAVNVPAAPYSAPSFMVATETDPTRNFQAGGSQLNVAFGFAQSPQRLILSTEAETRSAFA